MLMKDGVSLDHEYGNFLRRVPKSQCQQQKPVTPLIHEIPCFFLGEDFVLGYGHATTFSLQNKHLHFGGRFLQTLIKTNYFISLRGIGVPWHLPPCKPSTPSGGCAPQLKNPCTRQIHSQIACSI